MYTRATVSAPLLALVSTACLNIDTGPPGDPAPAPLGPDVSPPSLVLSRQDTSGNWDIYADDLTNLGVRNQTASDSASGSERLTEHPARDEHAALSPDGLRVVFQSERDGNWEIYITDTGGALDLVRITDNPARDVRPAWSPDGSTIAFGSDRGGSGSEIYLIDADGVGPARPLTNRQSDATDPDWSPNSSKIAFSATDETGFRQIYVINADGKDETRLTNEAVSSESPAWSPDGSEIAFARNWSIWIMHTDGSNQRVTIGEERNFLTAPDWDSPSGATIGLQLTCCERPEGIYVHNRFSGGLGFITAGRQPSWP